MTKVDIINKVVKAKPNKKPVIQRVILWLSYEVNSCMKPSHIMGIINKIQVKRGG